MIEGYINKGNANMWKGLESVGGKLYLTKENLIHVPHRLNFQSEKYSVALSDIDSIEFYNTLKIMPNGLIVILKNGEEKKFVVNGRKKWKREIENLL
ncbi:hypothetical protein [Salipaludibacillus daqingensis]|uniref:hypothetical protein n=1 Tax=Salipaludibacillus daqingensis TaxID=3041001 RepID=UPI0024772A04|nr:hypothetical protein [Salipaludibacillus daqingensis]